MSTLAIGNPWLGWALSRNPFFQEALTPESGSLHAGPFWPGERALVEPRVELVPEHLPAPPVLDSLPRVPEPERRVVELV